MPVTHQLPLSEDTFFDIINLAEDAIISINEKQEIVLFNHGAEKIFHFSVNEVIGQPLEILIPERWHPTHQQHVINFGNGPEVARRMAERREVFARRKDGTEFPAEISISRLLSAGQMLFTAIVRDCSERKRQEAEILKLNQELEARVAARTEELRAATQQLWQAAKLASVGELAASIAHELNNPLGTVSLRIESVLGVTPPEDGRRRLLEIIEAEVERMANLVANLLQFSRNSGDQISTVNVCEEIERALELTSPILRRRGVIVKREFDPSVPMLFADRQKLRQVFLNLLANAGDAMPQGGLLTQRVRQTVLDGNRPAVLIEFEDTGTGIAAEDLPRVMDPFFTTKEEGKGTGLGLAICKRVVQEHHGSLQISSLLGKGTTIRILLPIQSAVNSGSL